MLSRVPVQAETQDTDLKESKEVSRSATNTVDGYSILKETLQTRNTGQIVTVSGVIDDTEGLGAMDTLPFEPDTRNLDLGGGSFDRASAHLAYHYKVLNYVYDPYGRSKDHNEKVLATVQEKPVDTVTSNSVLNVILNENERLAHIHLAYNSLRSGGLAFFKVWRGDGSRTANQWHSNKDASCYEKEVAKIFGADQVKIPADDLGNTIIARKPAGQQ